MEIKEILSAAIDKNASDIILVADFPPVVRINGELKALSDSAIPAHALKEMLFSMLTKEQQDRLDRVKDLDAPFELGDRTRFRVNIHFQKNSLAAAFRPIPFEIPSAEAMRMPKVIYDLVKEPRGLILVTGPTGSGKTTSQAIMVDIINKTKNSHIITIEDPIEFTHANKKSVVEQREIGIDTPSFPSALMYALRQNPDVILIGEMRELGTISTAITAAETGHLVISTLHTNDAVQTIDRIIDVFPPYQQNQVRMQLSLTLQGVISQQLVPRTDGTGLILATEVLRVNTAIRNIIRKGNNQEIYSMLEIGAKYGMHTMDNSLKRLVDENLITFETALSRAQNPDNLEKILLKRS